MVSWCTKGAYNAQISPKSELCGFRWATNVSITLCSWQICHQTHVLCGCTTFAPNQIRYQINTVCLDKGVAYTKGGQVVLLTSPKGAALHTQGSPNGKKKSYHVPSQGSPKVVPPFERVQRARKESTCVCHFGMEYPGPSPNWSTGPRVTINCWNALMPCDGGTWEASCPRPWSEVYVLANAVTINAVCSTSAKLGNQRCQAIMSTNDKSAS